MVNNWRKISNSSNYAKGTKILNLANIWRINKLVGHSVDLYDFSKKGSLSKQKRTLKRFKLKKDAIAWRIDYMRKH